MDYARLVFVDISEAAQRVTHRVRQHRLFPLDDELVVVARYQSDVRGVGAIAIAGILIIVPVALNDTKHTRHRVVSRDIHNNVRRRRTVTCSLRGGSTFIFPPTSLETDDMKLTSMRDPYEYTKQEHERWTEEKTQLANRKRTNAAAEIVILYHRIDCTNCIVMDAAFTRENRLQPQFDYVTAGLEKSASRFCEGRSLKIITKTLERIFYES